MSRAGGFVVTIHDPRTNSYWKYRCGQGWYNKHDNGAMVSCGLTVGGKSGYSGKEYLSAATFDRMKKMYKNAPSALWRVDPEVGQHSGCQSSCVLRGDKQCRW